MAFEKQTDEQHYANHLKVITDMIDAGTIPWRKPWRVGQEMPCNLVSGRQYSGFSNIMVLSFSGHTSPYWITSNKIEEMGAKIAEGEEEKSQTVFYWHRHTYDYSETKNQDGTQGRRGTSFYPRTHEVWNTDQVEGLVHHRLVKPERVEHAPMPTVENIVDGYSKVGGPEIRIGGNHAYYNPLTHRVQVPDLGDFENPAEYASALFHELTHSTGHKKLLNRKGITELDRAHKEQYAREELVAEFGASFLLSRSGFSESEFDQAFKSNASYIAGWSKKIKEDPKMFITAGKQAEKACRLILGDAF